MNKKLINIAKVLFSLLLVTILLLKADIKKSFVTILHSDYWYFLLAFVVSFFGLFIGTFRWQIILKRFAPDLPFKDLFRYICLCFFYNFFIPGGFAGDLIRGYKCRGLKLKSMQGIASVFIDRLLGLSSFLFLSFIGIFFAFDILKSKNLITYAIIVLLSFCAFAFIIFNRKIMKKFKVIENFQKNIYEKLKELYDLIYYYKNSKNILFLAFLVSLIAALSNISIFFLLGNALNSAISFIYFLLFIPIIIIISYIPISYSGLGIREASFILLFAHVGMESNKCLALSLMYFNLLLMTGLLGGLVYIITKPDEIESNNI